MFPNLAQYPMVAFDTETTGLDWRTDQVFGFSISTPDGKDYYWDIRQTPKAVDWLAAELPKVPLVVNQHMKFDIHMSREMGVHLDPAKCDCTMIRAALINEHLRKYDLASLAKKYLKTVLKDEQIYIELAELFGGKPTRTVQVKNFPRAPVEMMSRYAKQDTRTALELWLWQKEEIEKQGLQQVCELERRLFPHVVEMERLGIRVDLDEAERRMDELDVRVKDLQAQLNSVAGFEINPNPSGSIHKLFDPKKNKDDVWVANDGTILESTDAGNASINADALKRMKHPASKLILRTRKLIKARDTFIGGHIIGHAINGYVHPNINQTKGDETGGTGTGRLSYTDPALQQIPARDKEIAALVRPVFLPDPGQDWAYGDLDQHELRIFHHYVNNPKIIEAYQNSPNLDGHQEVADLTGLPRNAPEVGGPNAKQLNLGMIFCMGTGHMAADAGLPFTWDEFENDQGELIRFQRSGEEGEEMVEKYHRMVPGVREIAKKAKSIAKSRGYVKTILGRHIRFPRGYGVRKASGLVYQGSSADLNKLNICIISEYLKSECPESRLLLNIHDEYSMSMVRDKKSIGHLQELRRLIEDKPMLRVPIRIDFSQPSANWWDATSAPKCT